MILLLALWMALTNYTIAPAPGNRFSLEVEKTGLMRGKHHTFSFPKYSGTVKYDVAHPENSAVAFTLEGASMICEDDWAKPSDREKINEWGLDKMILVKRYPEIKFVSSKISGGIGGRFVVSGQLTMRGVSRAATIDVAQSEQSGMLTLDGKSVVNMTEYGMKPPTAALGAVGTKPEMTVRFKIVAAQAK